jgi:RNA-directed DNA polymerase
VFRYIDHYVWKALFQWALRRHPNKGKKWVADKYFKTLKGVKWNFAVTVKDRRGKDKTLTLFKLPDLPISRHVKVKDTASPDDPQLAAYWRSRQTQYGKTYWDCGSKLYNIAHNQSWSCPVCGEHLFNGEQLHTHHVVPVKDGGTDREENLVHLHSSCHQHLHKGKRFLWQEA